MAGGGGGGGSMEGFPIVENLFMGSAGAAESVLYNSSPLCFGAYWAGPGCAVPCRAVPVGGWGGGVG